MRRRAQQLHRGFPVDGSGSRPQMGVAVPDIVVDMRRKYMDFHNFERLGYIAHDVGMAEIETYAYVVEVRNLDKLHQLVRYRELVGNILQQDAHSQRLGERAQVLD